ncbi:acyltransferase family protein [Undibacterium sp. RTI2.1]|uniref:acyltransferase family protein n=1 Tax=unclassified Undibacterium TaxID=2630295 RepID=UPI002AB5C545|nr:MULTISPECIES: acyltransferase family protein [unclassified Undibacterium]MDY7536982.1 acyltransferase family protein [Undibacterium sp. 5I1]MEB0033005.1 acyltransferase family protein [Undibacterium sp. RTI2.1]MEB0118861.1 acyltransferase family protein [Undibacterium sp. RTI2.2]MEB0231338.1 acyltransferase family protein [Undibacterium sp. 10I3]MEB0258751.1 acyltransferase family protein [Undibacterium sp. 5I1]
MSSLSRNFRIDNIKGVLIFLVVFGHLIELHIAGAHFLHSIWLFIYSFHMPMFALVSGMFSKASLDEKQGSQLVKNVVIPLVAFEIFYEGLELLLKGNLSVYSGLFAPYWMLWYLLSLLSWRLLLPIFSKLQFPVVIALAMSLIAGYSDSTGYFLSISRTLCFFPFFLLGWKMGPGAFDNTKKRLVFVSAPVVAIAITASFLLHSDFDYRWLYGSYSLNHLGMANMTGSLYQIAQYLASLTIGLACLHLLSLRNWGLAQVGQRSMYVFLWHGLALIVLQQTGILNEIFKLEQGLAIFTAIAVSALIVWLASHAWCELITQKLILKPMSWLFIRAQAASQLSPTKVIEVKVVPQKTLI